VAGLANLNLTFTISLIIIAIGYLTKRMGLLTKDGAGKALALIIFNITLPSVIITTLMQIQIDFAMILMPFFAIGVSGVNLAVARVVHRHEDRANRGLYTMMTLGWNVGNFAYPLVKAVFDINGLKYVALFDFGNAFIIFILCYSIAMRNAPGTANVIDKKAIAKKIVGSPPLLAYIIGILLNVGGVPFPADINLFFTTIANANSFLTFLVLGLYLDFTIDRSHWKKVFEVIGTRYVIGLAIGLLLYFLLPIPLLPRELLAVCLILPTGMALLVYVVQYNYNQEFAGMVSNLTNIISFGLMWFLLFILGVA